MRTRVLRRPIVFLRVRCSIYVRCSILILLIKAVRCSIVRCIILHCIYFIVETTHIVQHYEAKSFLRFHGNIGYAKATLRFVARIWSICFSHVPRSKILGPFNSNRAIYSLSYSPVPIGCPSMLYRCPPSEKAPITNPVEIMDDQWVFSVSTIHKEALLYNGVALVSTSDQ
jgi:hypothetical protein